MNVAGVARVLLASAAISGLIGVSGCGWAEWPPPDRAPRLASGPVAPPTASASDSLFVGADAVVVAKGDTVYEISRRHRVPMRAIIEANRLRPPYVLHVGQRIVLPRNMVHEVVKGDTLYGISRRYGVDTYALARANGMRDPMRSAWASASWSRRRSVRVRMGARRLGAEIRRPARRGRAGRGCGAAEALGAGARAADWGRKWVLLARERKRRLEFRTKGEGASNDGINIAAPLGSAVRAAAGGSVAYAGNELRGFGNLLLIKHQGGWITAYAHNDELLVKPGDVVRKGQPIARVGATGNVASPQLHFELRRGKTAVDPEKHLQGGSV